MARYLGREIDVVKRALALYGVKGKLRRVASGLDNTYRVVGLDQRLFALRVSSGMPIRNRPLTDNQQFDYSLYS